MDDSVGDTNLSSKNCSKHHYFDATSHRPEPPQVKLEDRPHEEEREQSLRTESSQLDSAVSFIGATNEQKLFKHIWTYHNALKSETEDSSSPSFTTISVATGSGRVDILEPDPPAGFAKTGSPAFYLF